ncbi:hypothetical protein DITRI_Ditri18aG0033600 [Diplodiscus trichospermus]
MFEYMERRELLQTPAEQSRLLLELPKVIGEEIIPETATQDDKHKNDSSQILTVRGTSEVPSDPTSNGDLSTLMPSTTNSAVQSSLVISNDNTAVQSSLVISKDNTVNKQLMQARDSKDESAEEVNIAEENGCIDQKRIVKVINTQVIELSDDEEKEEMKMVEGANDDVSRLIWHYADPQGEIQGPFSLKSLKAWMDAGYFPNDFKVWKTGEKRDRALLLTDIIGQMFGL